MNQNLKRNLEHKLLPPVMESNIASRKIFVKFGKENKEIL